MKVELNDIVDVLNRIYDDGDIPRSEAERFAEDILDIICDDKLCLNDIFIMAYEFESEMQTKGFEFEANNDWWLFNSILDLLERNPQNTKRLVESFLDYQDPMTFELIMKDFSKWLTPQERLKILDIAISTFDEIIWKDCI